MANQRNLFQEVAAAHPMKMLYLFCIDIILLLKEGNKHLFDFTSLEVWLLSSQTSEVAQVNVDRLLIIVF